MRQKGVIDAPGMDEQVRTEDRGWKKHISPWHGRTSAHRRQEPEKCKVIE